jgi:putative ABC transport system ATP-binding protein
MPIDVLDVSRVYLAGRPDEVVALRRCSAHFDAGSLAAIVGPSGSGKTTLLRLVAALDRPTTGDVRLGGQALSELSEAGLTALRRELGLVFQTPSMLLGTSCWENVAYPLIPRGVRRKERYRAALDALERVGVDHLAAKAPERLSGGERQRVGVARALVAEPSLVLADEPAAHVDDATAALVIQALRTVVDDGGTVLVASHRSDVRAAADAVLELAPSSPAPPLSP